MPDFAGERIHFVGVGGASMCALAEYAMLAGAEVSGSERRYGKTRRSRRGSLFRRKTGHNRTGGACRALIRGASV